MSTKTSRRSFLRYAITAIVAAAAAGGIVGWYYTYGPGGVQVSPGPPPPKKKGTIRIGYTQALTGWLADITARAEQARALWIEKVNKQGGVYVKEYGEKLPIEVVVYNDEGDTEKATRNAERLITVDKVDLLFHSYGTFQSMAVYPVVQKYATPMILDDHCPVQVSWRDIVEGRKAPPGSMFWVMDHPYRAMEGLVNLMKQVGVADVAVLQIQTLFGVVNWEPLEYLLKKEGINLVLKKEYPTDVRDFTGTLLEIKGKNPDAVVGLTYPADGWLLTEQMIELDVNPKLYYDALGAMNPDFVKRFGENREGVTAMGGCMYGVKAPWKSTIWSSCKEAYDAYYNKYGEILEMQDGVWVLMSGDAAVKAIEKAGTLDHDALRETLRTTDIETMGGVCHWLETEWSNTGYNVPQWIDGKPEIVAESWSYAGRSSITAKPLYPKPKWKR
jgi:branched-chain amino acid transport system substrate-binding protein